ncbi:MAG: RagB/SusD family nutrient uptake outer membrane protein [Prevotellaceae bacterium]|nr:RagB/SusD family nutrient uptake outer membrane protein [Prevotellaceae bacterium]
MKRYIITLSAAVVALCMSSCGDFLDVKPEKVPSDGTFFATDKDATDAMNAIYWMLNDETSFGRDLFWEQAGGGDDFIYGRNRGEDQNNLANFTYTGRESSLRSNWQLFNEYIAKANWMIYRLLKKSSLTPVETKRLGEAYFMRAFLHFHIAYRYGRAEQGVPFDRYEDYDLYEYKIPEQRASVTENYDLIMRDLEKAAASLPLFEEYSTGDYGRAHRAAAWAYMVKVNAYWAQHDASKWALIPPLVERIETEGKRGLLDDFAEVFTIANNWSREYIWSVNSSGYNYAGSEFPGVVLENKGWGRYNGWGYFKPTLGLYNEYASGDKRRGTTILAYNDPFVFFGEARRFHSASDLESGFQLAKYMEPFTYGKVENGIGVSDNVSPNGDRPTTDLNLPLIRHAEMILFKAEALIRQGNGTGAAAQLNRLTRRAGLGDVYANATMNDLKHERRCELAGEFSDRFMDLKRWEDWDKLNAPKTGRHHEERSNPESPWTPVEIWPARTFNPATDIVFPYNPDDVVKADGKLKQNPMD